jgi:hypothetical protein
MKTRLIWAAAAASLFATPALLAPAVKTVTSKIQSEGAKATQALAGETVTAQRPAPADANPAKLQPYQPEQR